MRSLEGLLSRHQLGRRTGPKRWRRWAAAIRELSGRRIPGAPLRMSAAPGGVEGKQCRQGVAAQIAWSICSINRAPRPSNTC